MGVYTRIVLPISVVENESVRSIATIMCERGIDPGQAFLAEITKSEIVIEQSREAKPIPGVCQFRTETR